MGLVNQNMINSDYFTEYDKTKTDVAYGLQSINKFNESQNDTLSSVQLLGRNNLRQSNKILYSRRHLSNQSSMKRL